MAKQVYNRIFSKEKWDKVNEFNKNLLNDYILQAKSEGKTEASIKQYFNDCRIILIYIMEEHKNKELYQLRAKSFRNFKLWMQDNGMSTARINRLLVSARNLLNFGTDDDEYSEEFEDLKVNPSRIKGLRKEEAREIVFLTDDEVNVIYNHLINKKRYSQALFCALLYDTAGRRKEIHQLKREDISYDGNMTKNKVVGKRKKEFYLLYNERTKEAYKLLEDSRKDNYTELFLTISGEPASYETLYNWSVSWRGILKDELNIEKELNVHSFRHSALENLSDGSHYIARRMGKKFELQELKLLANHESIETTSSYLRDKSDEMLLSAFGL